MSDEYCTCPVGRPLGAPHREDCPEAEGQVIVMRQPATGRPVAVPNDVVTKTDRAFAAYEKKLAGKSWQAIADEDGWPSAAAAQAEVKKYLDEGRGALATFKRADVMAVWTDRLEMLWEAVIPEARSGKVPSVMAALAVAKTAMTLQGLDQPSEEDTAVPTVVVPSEEYILQLQAASEAS